MTKSEDAGLPSGLYDEIIKRCARGQGTLFVSSSFGGSL